MGRRLIEEEIILKFKEIHGQKYDYSKVCYKGDSNKVIIVCKEHGEFKQRPGSHIRQKQGCPRCRVGGGQNKLSQQEVVTKIKEVWGEDYFDFSLTTYKNAHQKITLKCNKHDRTFSTHVRSLLKLGIGCSECNNEKFYIKHTKKHQDLFIKESIKVHGKGAYDYTKVSYINSNTPVVLICTRHGEFKQLPVVHKNMRSGCPVCKSSKGERAIYNYLTNLNIKFIPQHQIYYKNSFHYFDAFVPSRNLLIEYNGKQHYEVITWTSSMTPEEAEERFAYQQNRDYLKREYCKISNTRLLEISYEDYENINKILNNKL
jgi:hypothetical protein